MSTARPDAWCITQIHRLFWKHKRDLDFWAVASVIMYIEMGLALW